ncbi:MAG TPA: hypothetical protein VNH15_07020 [Elusimicrobiota bacterium]|nr:hypothetical protein [Elusimicrobiota bacterium]
MTKAELKAGSLAMFLALGTAVFAPPARGGGFGAWSDASFASSLGAIQRGAIQKSAAAWRPAARPQASWWRKKARQLEIAPLTVQKTAGASGDPPDMTANLLLIPCDFDGHQARCVLDSGNATTFVKYDAFSRGLDRVSGAEMEGASGKKVETALVQANDLSAGTIDFGSPQIFRVREPEKAAGSPFRYGAEGYLGIDVLYSKDSLEFDFGGASRLVADRPPSFAAATNRLSRTPTGHVVVSIGVGGGDIPALWDTGTSLTAVDLKYAKAHPDVFVPAGFTRTSDAAGIIQKTTIYRVKGGVSIGGYRLDGYAIGMDLSHLSGILQRRGISVILGGNFITRLDWYLNLRRKTWSVSPIGLSPVPGSPASRP